MLLKPCRIERCVKFKVDICVNSADGMETIDIRDTNLYAFGFNSPRLSGAADPTATTTDAAVTASDAADVVAVAPSLPLSAASPTPVYFNSLQVPNSDLTTRVPPDSALLTLEAAKQRELMSWLPGTVQAATLLFESSQHGLNSRAFHSKCDNQVGKSDVIHRY